MIASRMQENDAMAPVEIPVIESVKRSIIDHPLYTLLEIVFQKCELATCSPRDAESESVCSPESFNRELREFVEACKVQCREVTTNDAGVDQFMVKAIQVLRFHLLELDKVHQLCDSFCKRYITTLKGKMPVDYVVEDSNNNNSSSSGDNGNNSTGGASNNATLGTNNGPSNGTPNGQPNGTPSSSSTSNDVKHLDSLTAGNQQLAEYPTSTSATSSSYYYADHAPHSHQQPHSHQPQTHYSAGAAAAYPSLDASVKYERLGGALGEHATGDQKAQHLHISSNAAANSTTANSATTTPVASNNQDIKQEDARSPTGSTGSYLGNASLGSGDGTECDDDDARNSRRQQKKRGIFPKTATNAMRNWLFHHINHPYPSEEQKKQLAETTGLTILQVNNWFINARRRIVQPMIDHTNRHGGGGIMGASAYSPDAAAAAAAGMSYMMSAGHDRSQQFGALGGVDPTGMSLAAASHAAAAMSVYGAQHLSQAYGRPHPQSQPQAAHAAMLAAATHQQAPNPHMMGVLPPPPQDYY